MPRFKNPHMNKIYQHYISVDAETYEGAGSLFAAFRRGYAGLENKTAPRNSMAYAAYVAGKEQRRKNSK